MSTLLVRERLDQMHAYAYPAIMQFPKTERMVLGADIRHTLNELCRLIIAAEKKYYNKSTFTNIDILLGQLNQQIRCANTLGILSHRRYEIWSGLNVEIGKLIGGWIKAINGNKVNAL